MHVREKMAANSPATQQIWKSVWRPLLVALIIVLIATAAFIPVFLNGFPKGADIKHHYRWSFFFLQAIKKGYLYPRWLAEINRGYGSPVTLYYPPLSLYASAVFGSITDTLTSISLACWLALVFSGFAMYRFSRALLSTGQSLLASILYMLAPYHTFDLYRGNSIAEYWSFAWVPFVFYSAHRIASTRDWRPVVYLAFSYALLLLTDLPVSFAITLILPVFLIILTRKPRDWIRVGAGLALGAGISAVFLFSALFERGYVDPSPLLTEGYEQTFMFERLRQVLHTNLLSRAAYRGYAGYLLEAELVGFGLLLLLFVSAVLVWTAKWIEPGPRRKLLLSILAIGGVGMLMTTRLSSFIWKSVPEMQYLQVANRWLIVASITACLLAAAAIFNPSSSIRKRTLALAVLSPVILLNLVISAHITTQRTTESETLAATLLQADGKEFFPPKWWDQRWNDDFDNSPFVLNEGDCALSLIEDKGLDKSYDVRANTESTVTLKPLYFPGWTAGLDGKSIDIEPGMGGHIQTSIPAGDHRLALSFEDTPIRTAGKAVSSVSLALCLILLWVATTRHPQSCEKFRSWLRVDKRR